MKSASVIHSPKRLSIQRAADCLRSANEHIGMDHQGFHIFVPNVSSTVRMSYIACFEKMHSESDKVSNWNESLFRIIMVGGLSIAVLNEQNNNYE